MTTRKEVLSTQRRDRNGAELTEPLLRPMAFVTLEDESGSVESIWFPDAYQRFGAAMEGGEPFWVSGRIEVDYGVAVLVVDRARALEALSRAAEAHTQTPLQTGRDDVCTHATRAGSKPSPTR